MNSNFLAKKGLLCQGMGNDTFLTRVLENRNPMDIFTGNTVELSAHCNRGACQNCSLLIEDSWEGSKHMHRI